MGDLCRSVREIVPGTGLAHSAAPKIHHAVLQVVRGNRDIIDPTESNAAMRVMLDTNCLDALLEDKEAYLALLNRKDIRLLITPIQMAELQATPDEQKRLDLLNIAKILCSTLASPPVDKKPEISTDKHSHDKAILAASKHCDLLVSNDFGILELAFTPGIPSLTWKQFVKKYVFSDKKN